MKNSILDLRSGECGIRRHVMAKLDANPYLDRKYFLWRVGKMNKETDIQLKLTFFSWNRPIQGL